MATLKGMLRLAPLLLLMLVACAAPRPISYSRQSDYFDCRGVSVDQAHENLGEAGWPIGSKGKRFVQTEWIGLNETKGDEALARVLVGVHSVRYRVSVAATGDGARLSIYMAAAQGQVQHQAQWDTITEAQEADSTSRAVLNKIRRDTCGGSNYFDAPRD